MAKANLAANRTGFAKIGIKLTSKPPKGKALYSHAGHGTKK